TSFGVIFPGVSAKPDFSMALLLPISFVALVAGLSMIVQGGVDLARHLKRNEWKESHPREAWRWDYPWKPEGIGSDSVFQIFRHIITGIVFVIFLTPFNYLLYTGKVDSWVWYVGVSVLDLATIAVFGLAFYRILQFEKYGNHQLEFKRFPFFL